MMWGVRLYYNKWRMGNKWDLISKPELKNDPVPAEPVMGEMLEWWFQPGLPLDKTTQFYLTLYFFRIAIQTYKITGIGLQPWVLDKVVWVAGHAAMVQVCQYLILCLAFYYFLAVFTDPVMEHAENHKWGTDFMMRHQGRLWHAKFEAFTPRGRPWFTRGTEVGQVLLRERHNVSYGGLWGDYWEFLGLWKEVKKAWPVWHVWEWWYGMMGWVGYLTQCAPGVYILQPPYVDNMPML